LKVGVILPLTGDAAAYGTSARAGMDLAFEELNAAGGINGQRVQPIYEDSKADAKAAVTALQKLVDLDKVPVVLGPMTSSEALAVAPVAERRRVVLFTPTASAPALTTAGDYVFRNLTSDLYDGIAMAKYAHDTLKVKSAAICYTNNDFGLGLRQAFEQEFKRLGGSVVDVEALAVGATDFRSQIQKVKQAAPEVLFLVGGKEMGRFLKQAKELAVRARVLSVAVFEDPEILSVAGSAANGAHYTYRTYDPGDKEGAVAEFVKKFKARFKKEPDIYAALSFDAVNLLAEAVKTHGATSDHIKAGLYAIKDFPGVTGTTTFDRNGDVVKPIGIKMVKDGKFIWVERPQ
jgi:branched-chain amino acid transport system substrate-binding protein